MENSELLTVSEFMLNKLLCLKFKQFDKVEYDTQFEVTKKVYLDFVYSSYNDDKNPEYDSMEDFINSETYTVNGLINDYMTIK